MPKFDIQCVRCKQIKEVILTVYKDNFKQNCDICNFITWWETQAPLVNMQPDKYWSGRVTNHAGYVTSGSYLKRFEKQNNLERVDQSVLDEVKKKSDNRVPEWQAKNKKGLNDFLQKELGDVEITPDGNTVKERNKYNKVRQ